MAGHSNDAKGARRLGTAVRSGWAGLARSVAAAAGALTLAVAGLGVLATPAWAASPTISVSPTTAVAGGRVTVSGTGWNPYDSVNIELGPSDVSMCHVSALSTGTVPGQTCTVPSTLAQGSYAVTAVTSASTVSGGSLVIDPSVSLLGESGAATSTAAPAQSIGVSGGGFAADSALTVKFGATTVSLSGTTDTNSSGQVSNASFPVPSGAPAGVTVVTVTDAHGNAATYDLDIYQSTITASTDAVSGQTFTVSGSNWPVSDNVTIRLVQGGTATTACTVAADTSGALTEASCTAPMSLPQGMYTVNAEDGAISVNGTAQVTLLPGIVLLGESNKPTNDAAPNQTIGLTGSGFTANSPITAWFDSASVILNNPTTDATGSFTGEQYLVPATATPGPHTVMVQDGDGNTATFTVIVYQATISTGASSGISGRQVTFSGSGWPGEDTLTISFVGSSSTTNACKTPVVTVITNSDGSFDVHSCTIPTTIPQGNYTVNAVDGSLSVNQAGPAFIVEPGIVLTGESGSTTANADQHQTVGVKATGFAATSILHIKFNGVKRKAITAHTTTSAGSVTTSFVVPPVTAPETVTVTVNDAAGNKASATLNVFQAHVVPAATNGVSGHHMSFTGSGWPGGDTVTLRLVAGSTATTVCQVTANSSGVVDKQTCPVPTSLPDAPYTLNAEDGFISFDYGTPFTVNPGITLVLVKNTGVPNPPPVISRAAVGQVVGVVGTGFASGSSVTALFGSTPVGLTSSTPSSTGTLPTGTSTPEFTVQPVSQPGPVTITITDSLGDSATYSLYVYQATITHSPAADSSGHRVTFSGSGWPDDASVSVSLFLSYTSTDTPTSVCTISADSDGNIAQQACTVPTTLPANSYYLNASDGQIYINDDSAFDLTPGLTLYGATSKVATTTAAVGQSIGMGGTGYATGTSITVEFGSQPVSFSPAPTITSDGSFSGTSFTVPPVASTGPVTVTVTDSDADSASYVLDVYEPSISASTSTAVSATPVGYSGSGWPANDPVKVQLTSGSTTISVCTVTSDSTGTLNLSTCDVPVAAPAGTYTVNATDGSISVNGGTLAVTPTAAVYSSATGTTPISSAAPNTKVYLFGTGFAASSDITSVSFNSTPTPTTVSLTPTDPPTNSSGELSTSAHPSFTVPTTITGTFTVTVTDGHGNVATFQFTIT